MADYYVGPTADYATPKAAIDQLKIDTGGVGFAAEHRIIVTNSAAYEGYTLSGLVPTAVNRLVITASTAAKPTLIPRSGGLLTTYCVKVDVPYVTMERHHLQGGQVGLLATANATSLNLKQMMVRDPSRIGILVSGADQFVIYNSVVYAPNTCLVGTSLNDAAIIFCTMKNGQNAVSRDASLDENLLSIYPSSSVLWLQGQEDPTGEIYIHDNNLVAVCGPVIATTEDTVDQLDSDYNNLYSTSRAVAMVVPNFSQKAMPIETWRSRFSQDSNSMAEDPRFYQGKVDGDLEDGIYQDLRLRASSLIRAKSEPNTDFTNYPAFVPDTNFTGDFNDTDRPTPRATLGAYELGSSIYNYWDVILPGSGSTPHQDIPGIYEAAKAHYASVVQPWYPKLRTGFFWARDNLFYLYSSKQTARLDQLRWFQWDMTGDPIPSSLTAYYDSGELTEDQWNVRGDTFYFKSGGFNVADVTKVVELSGEQLIWNSGDNDFDTGEFYWSNTIASGETIYVLDPAPLDGAPIVITDTSIDPSDSTGDLPFGFAISYDEDIDQVVIEFQSGELPQERFMGSMGDTYVVNDFIANFTWGAFALYGDYIANFPGLETFGVFTRTFEYEELTDMTVEWEGSATGIYEITDLSMNPIHNPQTDGFLSIRNIHAHIWDRTLASGESTLEDDWFAARTGDLLPWAKVTGKNKWHPLIREFSAPVPREAALNFETGELHTINSVPGPLVALQGTTGEEVLFTAYDEEENPWAFELMNFALTSTTGEDTGEFPGYIAKREFGLYTKLGTTLTAETDAGGHIALRYIPPAENVVTVFGPTIITSGDDRWINTRYDIYPDNHGNPTIFGSDSQYADTTGEEMSSEYSGEYSGGFYYYDLSRYPYRGSVSVVEDGIRQQVVYYETVQDGQVFVDYENKQVKSKSDGPITVTFTPLLVWKESDYPRRYYLHSSFSLPASPVLSYDAWIRLTGSAGDVSQTHDIVCRNPYDTGEI